MSELSTRVAKIAFITRDSEAALLLARGCPSDFTSRAIARHVLVRGKDLIDHSRQVRRPLREAGFDPARLHEAKEAYAEQFEEYFAVTRSRVSAHVQDLDFINRIELWNEIEVSKLAYLVDGAREILGTLPEELLPPDSNATSLTESDVAARLAGWPQQGTEMGMDVLAATRPNTVSMINTTPPHQRAGQLALITIWIEEQLRLVVRLRDDVGVFRVLVARLVCDVVSFADCLFTRADAGEKQAHDGLDDILLGAGAMSETIAAFKHRYRLAQKLGPLRRIRNRIGGHLEIDAAVGLTELLRDLDDLDLNELLRFFAHLHACFAAVCREVHYLGGYSEPRIAMWSAVSVASPEDTLVPFEPLSRPAVVHGPVAPNSVDDCIESWVQGRFGKDSCRMYMWSAYESTPVVERCEDVERVSGQVMCSSTFDVREAHVSTLAWLERCSSRQEAVRILELVTACARGYPRPLMEIVERYWRSSTCQLAFADFASAVSELAGWGRAQEVLLGEVRRHPSWQASVAVRSLFVVFLREQTMRRANRKGVELQFEAAIEPLLDELDGAVRTSTLLALASEAHWSRLASGHAQQERETLLGMLERDIQKALPQPMPAKRAATISRLLAWRDFVGLSVLFGDAAAANGREDDAMHFYEAVSEGLVEPAHHAMGGANLALALHRAGRVEEATQVAERVVERSPANPDYSLHLARLLADSGRTKQALTVMKRLEEDYHLDGAELAAIATVRQGLETGVFE